jgi:hypothetical protein
VSVEEAFAKVVGRPPSEEERGRLYHLREALDLHDNDAFWAIVIALEYYNSFFRAYPDKLAERTVECIENARSAFAVAASQEAARAQRLLAERVAETSVQIARKLAERPVGVHHITSILALAVGFGLLCVHAGYSLAILDKPWWVAGRESASATERTLAILLRVPAGWMVFALLLPVAAYGGKVGWGLAKGVLSEWREKALGWCLLVVCVVGGLACALLLAKLT